MNVLATGLGGQLGGLPHLYARLMLRFELLIFWSPHRRCSARLGILNGSVERIQVRDFQDRAKPPMIQGGDDESLLSASPDCLRLEARVGTLARAQYSAGPQEHSARR